MQAALAALTPDLRQLIRTGAINYAQAQDMMLEQNLFHGRQTTAANTTTTTTSTFTATTLTSTSTTNTAAASTTTTTTSTYTPTKSKKRNLKVRSRGNQPDQDIHLTNAINALGRLLGTLPLGNTGSGLLALLPSDILCPLLASLDIDELLYLGTTNRVWKSISRSDALWRRVYLARWKEPKPPAADAECPRYILNFYELYTRRILITVLKGPREVVDLTEHLRPAVEAGKVAPSLPAFVQATFQGVNTVVAANVEGHAIMFDSQYKKKSKSSSSSSSSGAFGASYRSICQVEGRRVQEHEKNKAYIAEKLKELKQPWKNSLVQFKLNKTIKTGSNSSSSRPSSSLPSSSSSSSTTTSSSQLSSVATVGSVRNGFTSPHKLLRSSSSSSNNCRDSNSNSNNNGKQHARVTSPGGFDLWGNAVEDDDAIEEEKLTSITISNKVKSPFAAVPINIHAKKNKKSRRISATPPSFASSSDLTDLNGLNGLNGLNAFHGSTITGTSPVVPVSPALRFSSYMSSDGEGHVSGSLGSSFGGSSSYGSSFESDPMALMKARAKASGGKSKTSSKKMKRELKKFEKLRKQQIRKEQAAAMKQSQQLDIERKRRQREEERAVRAATTATSTIALAKVTTSTAIAAPGTSPLTTGLPSPSPIAISGFPPRNSGLSAVLARMPEGSPPPQNTNGVGMCQRLSGKKDKNGKNGKKGKKGKKGGRKKKRNSWQQSRDDRLQNAREELNKRRGVTKLRNQQHHNSSPYNSSSDSESMSGTTSDSDTSSEYFGGSPSSFSLLEQNESSSNDRGGHGGHGGHQLGRRTVINMSMPLFIKEDVHPSMVIAEDGSSTAVAFDIRQRTEESKRHLASTTTSTNHEEKESTESKKMELLRPVSLQRPRWIRGDQWHVRSATTSLTSYVVLGHSGEPGAAAITVWDRTTGKQLHTMYGPRGAVISLSPVTERIIVSGDEGGAVCVWNVKLGTMLCTMGSTGTSPVTSLSVARTSSLSIPYVVMAGDGNGTLRVWEGMKSGMKSRSTEHNEKESSGSRLSMAPTPSQVVASSPSAKLPKPSAPKPSAPTAQVVGEESDSSVLSFQLRDQYFQAHLSQVTATAIAQWQEPVRLVVSGSEDWTIRLWETVIHVDGVAESGSEVGSTKQRTVNQATGDSHGGWSGVLRGHTGPITGIALDLCKVTSCSLDGTIKIWGTVGKNAGNCFRTLSHPFSGARMIPVRCVCVGTLRLVAGFEDGSLLLYNFGKKESTLLKKKRTKKVTNAWRKGGNSPQAKRHGKNTLKGSNRKYVSGGNRRSLRDLQARTSKNVDMFFAFDDDF